jgi:hypothetical protein
MNEVYKKSSNTTVEIIGYKIKNQKIKIINQSNTKIETFLNKKDILDKSHPHFASS